MKTPVVHSFFDPATFTVSHIVADPETKACAIIDSVLDYQPESGATQTTSADLLLATIREHAYTVTWILETHMHADHLTAAHYLKQRTGAPVAIGERICDVQKVFGDVFDEGMDFARDGSQFDHLFADGEIFHVGNIEARVLFTPGHTPADATYIIGDAVFVGDTLFMPDYGSARTDFPGGDAATLFASAQKILELPEEYRMFLCHDYLPAGRTTYAWETTVGEQREKNIHLNIHAHADTFAQARATRDATLGIPRLIIPSLQVNMRAGALPTNAKGAPFLKIPVNSVFAQK